MTRDEAVWLFGKMEERETCCMGEDLTDWAVAVGMLKLDEPEVTGVLKRAAAKINTVLKYDLNAGYPSDAIDIFMAISDAGLKIVEK